MTTMSELEHVISMLRACVLSTKNDISLSILKQDYKKLVGSEIPYQALGYNSLVAFLESVPALKLKRGPEGYHTISAAPTERSQHIADLVSRQKSPVKKISPKYIPPDRRNAASWTSPYKSSYYKPREEIDRDKPYGEFGYKGRDSFRGRGGYKGSSDRYNPKGKDYYKDPKEYNSFYKSSDHSQPHSKTWNSYQGPDRYNDRNYHKRIVVSPQDTDNSIAENWDEPSEERNDPISPEIPQPSEELIKEEVTSPICAGSETSPDNASKPSSKNFGTDAKSVAVKEIKKLPDTTTEPLRSRLSGPTPAQLRLNAQRKAALKKAEEEAQITDNINNVTEALDSLSVESSQLIEMAEDMPLNVTYYSRLMSDHIAEKGLPKAEVLITSRWISNTKLHCCELKLGVLAVTSFPFENMDLDVVVDYACREVLRALNQVCLPVEVHTSQPKEVLHRLLRMIFLHPRGIWNTSLPRLYSVAFKEPIPSNWMDLVHTIDKHQVQIVQSQNTGVFILKPNLVGINILSNEPSTSPSLQPTSVSTTQQNPAMSILVQDLPQNSSYPDAVGLPAPAPQIFMPMSMNMRLNPRMRNPVLNNNPLTPNTFGPMGVPGIRPRMGRGRGSRNIDSVDSIFNSPMFTEQFLFPMGQETSSIPTLPLSKEALESLNMLDSNSSSNSTSQESVPPHRSSSLMSSPEMNTQLNTNRVVTHLSGSETASSTTMSLPTLSPEPTSPELVSELVVENVKAHNMAGTGISEKLTLPQDDAWDVQVTAANSIHEVWVRLIGDFHSVAYNNMVADMEIHYMNLNDDPLVPVELKLGSYYAIQLESCWHRVKLVELPQSENDGVTLFFIDQGDEEKYPFSMCYFLDPQFMALPGQAVHCHLAFMEMFRKDMLITEHLINILVGNCFVANVLSLQNSKAYIVLYNTENNSDINVNNLVVEKLAECLRPTDLNEVGSVIEVLLSHVADDGTVYIQMLDTAYYCIQYMTYQLTNYPMKKSIKTINPFRSGEIYLARYNLEEDLLRVVIKSKPDDQQQVLVHYIDYGFMESLPVKLMLRATDFSKAIQDIPPLAKKVKLSNLPPSHFTSQMASRLQSLVPNSVSALAKVLRRPDEDLAEVELFKRIQPDNLLVSVNNTLLLDPHLATPSAEEQRHDKGESTIHNRREGSTNTPDGKPRVNDAKTKERLESIKQSFKPLAIPNIGEEFDIHVAMASNPSNFTVQPWSQNQQLDQMMQEMQKVYDGQVHDELTVDEIIPGGVYAALNSTDNHWYRATVSRKMGSFDKAAIFVCFNDFGDFNIVPLERIKMLDACFKDLPVQAIKAKLSNVGPVHADWSVEACLFFQKLVNQREFVSIVMENGPDLLNPADMVIGLRLIDTSSDKDVYIDKLLVDKGHGVYINKTDK